MDLKMKKWIIFDVDDVVVSYRESLYQSFKLLGKDIHWSEWKTYKHVNIYGLNNYEELCEAIKILGDDNYQLGDNQRIETLLPVPETKKTDINELQKFYFSKFLNIALKNTNYNSKTSTEVKKKIIIQIRENIEQDFSIQGIKLRK